MILYETEIFLKFHQNILLFYRFITTVNILLLQVIQLRLILWPSLVAIILDCDIFSDYSSLLGWLQILSTKLNQLFQITMNISPAQLSTFLTSSMPTLANLYSTIPPIFAQPLLQTLILLSQHESLTMFSAGSTPAWPALCFPFVLHNRPHQSQLILFCSNDSPAYLDYEKVPSTALKSFYPALSCTQEIYQSHLC